MPKKTALISTGAETYCRQLFRLAAAMIAITISAAAIYTAGFGVYDEALVRGGTVACGLLYILCASLGSVSEEGQRRRAGSSIADLLLIVGTILAIGNFFVLYDDLQTGLFQLSEFDLVTGWAGIAVILEVTRRIFGLPLFLVTGGAVVYCLWGNYLPWIFQHAGFSAEQTLTTLWFGFDGVYGRAIAVVTNFILVFIVFGSVLEGVGAGNSILKIVFRLTGRFRGGPAYAAVVSSAIFGTLSGSVAANVVGTGVFTIPMIKKRGFSSRFAGGIEAAASSGGQIMPPVMGAVAFIMADVTGIPYLTICLAALVPAVFYYAGLFCAVGVQASKLGIEPEGGSAEETITGLDWRLSGALLFALLVIVYMLITGRSPAMAGFWAVIVALLSGVILNSELWRKPRLLLAIFVNAGRSCAIIIVAVAAIGIVIGTMSMTGLGLRFASVILALSENSIILSLLLMMAGCLILGMGMPTVPAYLIIVLVMGTAIEKMGFSTLTVHLFVVYFGVLSSITPPVAIAAYAAAPISGSKPMETAVESVRIALAGFVIPFFFIFNPEIVLVEGFSVLGLLLACLRLGMAVWLIATALTGHEKTSLPVWQRAARLALPIALIVPVPASEFASLAAGALLIAIQRLHAKSAFTSPNQPKGRHKEC
ncbi:MAG: TRAP transporter fused permease subunit [Rhodobacteraceae bacterium]|nr:TRAP transporter fused permease subunit [Paracoccaceae bacterium]